MKNKKEKIKKKWRLIIKGIEDINIMPRPRKPLEDKIDTIFVKVPKKVIWALEEQGNKNEIASKVIMDYYNTHLAKKD
ncbi:hypothetical protein [Bacillus thuringiensis]|uniref:hypothetical protein n=2 Tax=Bacillus cereus group TaxID=86661 RepID=UPI001427A5EA|nr:hypothetical protein [Bacillus thuringiensis]NIL33874.1 hypothetical protein [Bacillus thuringiensis]